jgi:hypothetical protein
MTAIAYGEQNTVPWPCMRYYSFTNSDRYSTGNQPLFPFVARALKWQGTYPLRLGINHFLITDTLW